MVLDERVLAALPRNTGPTEVPRPRIGELVGELVGLGELVE